MAIQNIKCPNCGGEVQMEDSLEKGFCMYCGGVIHIKEEITKIQIEHSGKIEYTGKVEIDDSKKLANALELADRAFNSGNYPECYSYCCVALECDINNAQAIFRKGLCAAYISFSRINELEQSTKTAIEIINKTSNNVDLDIYSIFSQLFRYIRSMYDLNCNRPRGYTYPNYAAANNAFSMVIGLTNLSSACSDLISNKMIAEHPTFENDKKNCLELGLQLCTLGLSSFKYVKGYEQEKDGDTYVQKEVYDNLKSPFHDVQKRYEAKLKFDFNNLPTTQKALMEYDQRIGKLQNDIDAFNKKLEQYFAANPEKGEQYKKKSWPFIVAAGADFSLLVFLGILLGASEADALFALVVVLLTLGFIALVILFFVKLIVNFIKRKNILNALPPELASLKNINDINKKELEKTKNAKADFMRKNTKK